MPRRFRLELQHLERRVRDLSPGEVGFVLASRIYATRPEGFVWISAEADVHSERVSLYDCHIRRLKRSVRVLAPFGTLFRLEDKHWPDDLSARVDFEEVEDEEQDGEP